MPENLLSNLVIFKNFLLNNLELVFIITIILILLFQTLGVLIKYLRYTIASKNLAVLEILPKDSVNIQETEKLIKNIHSTLLNTGFRRFRYGRTFLTYEIAAEKDEIKFYLLIPKNYTDNIIERMYGTYSEIAIRKTEDYLLNREWPILPEYIKYIYKKIKKEDTKKPKKPLKIFATEMEITYHHVFSVVTTNQNDILKSILSAMRNLEKHEKIVFQVVASPLDSSWQRNGRKILEDFEINKKRPFRGSNFSINFSSFIDQLFDELGKEAEKIGLSTGSKRKKITKLERSEINVASTKLKDVGFETTIRIIGLGNHRVNTRNRVKTLSAALSELDKENRFKRKFIYLKKKTYKHTKKRTPYLHDRKNILSSAELANFFLRLPDRETLDEFKEIEALKVKEFAPPKNIDKGQIVLGKNIYRAKETLITLLYKDFKRHIIGSGKTGSGKSEFAKTVLRDHANRGLGFCLIEPHGPLTDEILELIPEHRIKDVVYLDLFDPYVLGLNICKVFQRKNREFIDTIEKETNSVIKTFRNIFSDAWSSKNETFLTNAVKTAMYMGGNILDVQRLFNDEEFREEAKSKVKDSQLKMFWTEEFRMENGRLSIETRSTVRSLSYKLGSFLNSPRFLRAVGQDDGIDFKKIIDENKIFILKASKDNMSEDRVRFLGTIILNKFIENFFDRDKSKWNDPYLLLADEMQNYADSSIKTAAYEIRKFGGAFLGLHQNNEQLDKVKGLKEAIYGNFGTTITFMVGQDDAPYFVQRYGRKLDMEDFINLPSRHAYVKTLVNGETTDTFNMYTLDKLEVDEETAKQTVKAIIENNRKNRKHFKQIDKEIKMKSLGLNLEDYEEKTNFKKQLSEEEVYNNKKEKYKEVAHEDPYTDPEKEQTEENEEDNEVKTIEIINNSSNCDKIPTKNNLWEQEKNKEDNIIKKQEEVKEKSNKLWEAASKAEEKREGE